MGMSFLILWGVLGFATVQDDSDGKPWPDVLWPTTAQSITEGSTGHAAMHTIGVLMMLCAVVVIAAHPAAHVYRRAAFIRWVGLWLGAVTAGLLAASIVAVLFVNPEHVLAVWPLSLAFWLLIVFMFGLGLRLVNCAYKADFVLEPEMLVAQCQRNPGPM